MRKEICNACPHLSVWKKDEVRNPNCKTENAKMQACHFEERPGKMFTGRGEMWQLVHLQRHPSWFWMSRWTGNLRMTCCLIYTLFPVGYHSLLSIWLQTQATIRNLGLCTSRLSHRAIYSRCFALSQTKSISIKMTTVLKKSLLRWRSPSWCSKVKR